MFGSPYVHSSSKTGNGPHPGVRLSPHRPSGVGGENKPRTGSSAAPRALPTRSWPPPLRGHIRGARGCWCMGQRPAGLSRRLKEPFHVVPRVAHGCLSCIVVPVAWAPLAPNSLTTPHLPPPPPPVRSSGGPALHLSGFASAPSVSVIFSLLHATPSRAGLQLSWASGALVEPSPLIISSPFNSPHATLNILYISA